ncbi:helix-turn-helix domain-containing protein [Jiangella mangrovi]|uniref:Transcriptional regulator with XRE-family HTH domain n=1 Tax=Jiangella mangrovi TaxID=1524084 RepID=A0A7W9GQ33_9ACTN|nr:helix-turn-helix transcriptional regulator [Jiangella mangrovi]MBB5787969.1 transcriptional regulator with XRE-family HTH domain [Jiangella mangrovi]
MTKAGIGEFLREQRRTAQLSLRQLSDLAGVSNPYLSQIERGLRKPSAEVLQQIAKALRISSEALYVRAGLLDEPSGDHSVEDAVLADPHLDEQQKRALLDVYASFRAATSARHGTEREG